MPCRELSYASRDDWSAINAWLEQRKDPDTKVDAIVRDILTNVQENGDEAIAEYTRKFDCEGFDPANIRVPSTAIEAALKEIPATDADILEEAIHRVRSFHANQKKNPGGQPAKTEQSLARWFVQSTGSASMFPAGREAKHPLFPASS